MCGLVEDFDRFADRFPEPVLLLSSTGQLYSANARARQQLLEDAQFAAGEPVFAFLEDQAAKINEYLRACSRSAEPLPGLFTFRRRNGAPAQFRSMGSSFRSRDGQQRPLVVLRFSAKETSASRFVALNLQMDQLRTEIARRNKAEKTAQEQRQLLEVTLSSIGDAVIATDMQGHVTFLNPVAEALLGRKRDECLGRPLQSVFVTRNERSGATLDNPVHEVLQGSSVPGLAAQTVLVRPNGLQVPIDDSAAPIRDSTGKLLGVILVFREISESRRLQLELMRQADALKEADRRKDEFLAVLAHELRNPLSPLRNGLQIARSRVHSDQTLRRTVEIMDRQLEHLVRLVDDLMDVSRVTRGVIELRKAPVFIRDVLARSAEAVRADIESRRHQFRIDIDVDIAVHGDADRLAQVFSNLLTNSSKYSPAGGCIALSVATEGCEVVVQVCDNGIGIPGDQLERVFDMFSQVRMHQGRYEGGLGIGLALVRTIVGMHDGTVSAHSAGPGRGSTFTVRLPILQAHATEPAALVARASSGDALRILVVDDNADSAESLRVLLEINGHEVRTAASGGEALEQVGAFRPAVVFMDIGMPGMDGVEATRLLRQRPDTQNIVVVALTGWGQPKDRERTRLAGADRHIVKPIGPEDLQEVLALARARDR